MFGVLQYKWRGVPRVILTVKNRKTVKTTQLYCIQRITDYYRQWIRDVANHQRCDGENPGLHQHLLAENRPPSVVWQSYQRGPMVDGEPRTSGCRNYLSTLGGPSHTLRKPSSHRQALTWNPKGLSMIDLKSMGYSWATYREGSRRQETTETHRQWLMLPEERMDYVS
jgi:hypothetical protein